MLYYVNDNPQPDGYHEVHDQDCSWLSLVESKTYLGTFQHCKGAVEAAKMKYSKSDGCAHCSPECHKH